MKKICRRKTIIRERDFRTILKSQAYAAGYTNAYWEPLSLDKIGQEMIVLILKEELKEFDPYTSTKENKKYVHIWKKLDNEQFRIYISYILKKTNVYKKDYFEHQWKLEDDKIFMRYRKNTPWGVLGMAVLEREYEIQK